MPSNAPALLIALLFVHFLLDFALQPKSWVAERYARHAASARLYWHALGHGLGTGLCFAVFGASLLACVTAACVVLVTHYLIDLAKSFLPQQSLWAFIGDQLLHWLVLLAVWGNYAGFAAFTSVATPVLTTPTLVVALGFFLVLKPTSVFIALCLQPWVKELQAVENEQDSLTKAGAMIGYLERLLILTFVLVGEYTAIGFVMALKTAFRFKDTDDRRKAEYMMMGTFLSFTLTIGIGLLAKMVLSNL